MATSVTLHGPSGRICQVPAAGAHLYLAVGWSITPPTAPPPAPEPYEVAGDLEDNADDPFAFD